MSKPLAVTDLSNTEQAPLPPLSADERAAAWRQAETSPRRRFAKILHLPGEMLNRVYNFMLRASYMQPHLHPGDEKIEIITLVEGCCTVLYFDEQGQITARFKLEKNGLETLAVPAYTWHTYVMESERVLTFETMRGVYHAETWKRLAEWAPGEGTAEAANYLDRLRKQTVFKP